MYAVVSALRNGNQAFATTIAQITRWPSVSLVSVISPKGSETPIIV
jgi:hypothetical protein